MGQPVTHEVFSLLSNTRSPATLNAYHHALGIFRDWQEENPLERTKDQLISAAIFLAWRSRTKGSGAMATFVSALSYERFGRKPEEAQQWVILDELVKGKNDPRHSGIRNSPHMRKKRPYY